MNNEYVNDIGDNISDIAIDCSVCGKKSVNLPVCPRCESDLSVLLKITHDAHTLANQAKLAIRDMEPKRAIELAIKSWNLKKNSVAAQVASLAYCALNDFVEVLNWYRRYTSVD